MTEFSELVTISSAQHFHKNIIGRYVDILFFWVEIGEFSLGCFPLYSGTTVLLETEPLMPDGVTDTFLLFWVNTSSLKVF